MRVALLTPTLEMGGVERVFVNLANGFYQRGIETDLVAGTTAGSMGAFLDGNIPMFDLASSHMIRSVPKLAKYLRHRRPDALIAAMTHSTAAAVAARTIAQVKTRILATEHNTMSKVVANTPGLKYRLMPLWSRQALGSADAIVAVSRGVANDLSTQTGIARENIQVIYNPVITDALHKAAAAPVEHSWFKPYWLPVVLAVGRLDRQKDFSMLVRAFSLVKQRFAARLLILGEGPDRPRVERAVAELRLQESVAMPGFEQNPYRFMARSAVFASSSEWEGFGVALVEAMALGMSVVSTNCTHGPAEILCHGKFGALVPVGDHEAMAQALLLALKSSAHEDRTAHLEQFTVQKVVSEYLSLIASKKYATG